MMRHGREGARLGAAAQKISGDPVRIFLYSGGGRVGRACWPALLSFKRILFCLVLLAPAAGTALSLLLADNTSQIVCRKRYSRRAVLEELPALRPALRLTRPAPLPAPYQEQEEEEEEDPPPYTALLPSLPPYQEAVSQMGERLHQARETQLL